MENNRDSGGISGLLGRIGDGDRDAMNRLFPLVYAELRRIAQRQLGGERTGHTLDATALVHEAYLKLLDGPPVETRDRSHFLAIAARAMRQILVDHARRRAAAKRGGDRILTSITDKHPPEVFDFVGLLALDRAIESLEDRQRAIVEYRYFGGMNEEEIATVLGVSTRTVQRDWLKARAWIYQALYPEPA
jgi:RNA polymerase sigma-70 factor (ECF subfamily)